MSEMHPESSDGMSSHYKRCEEGPVTELTAC